MIKRHLCIIFIWIASCAIYAQSDEVVVFDDFEDNEKCAQVVYLEESSEIIIKNPIDTVYILQIYNLTGIVVKKIEDVKPGISKINVSDLIKGIYLIKITPVPDFPSATFKVVIR